ncbi:hypothetical protein HDV01_007110 [Terramyces sp. JEL0728]|nr:hypothetical protein HDV01_007110 [Terramyces sp. JEL0728]
MSFDQLFNRSSISQGNLLVLIIGFVITTLFISLVITAFASLLKARQERARRMEWIRYDPATKRTVADSFGPTVTKSVYNLLCPELLLLIAQYFDAPATFLNLMRTSKQLHTSLNRIKRHVFPNQQLKTSLDAGNTSDFIFFLQKITDKSNLLQPCFTTACKNGYYGIAKYLLENQEIDPNANYNIAMWFANENGFSDIFLMILENNKMQTNSRYANCDTILHWAIGNGNTEMVRMCLQHTDLDPSIDNNFAIRRASSMGHVRIVKLLLQDSRVDPSAKENDSIIYACKCGHVSIVKLLLGHSSVDPSDRRNEAIIWATYHGHREIVSLLLKDSRVDPSANYNEALCYARKNRSMDLVQLLIADKRVKALCSTLLLVRLRLNYRWQQLRKQRQDRRVVKFFSL